jgi:protein O-GlcNAc transferase
VSARRVRKGEPEPVVQVQASGGSEGEPSGSDPFIALETLPRDPRERAALLAQEGQHLQALDLYAEIVAESPDDVAALIGYGVALLGAGRYNLAEKELRRAQKLRPDDPDAHYHLGATLIKRGSYGPAAAALRRSLELDPDRAEAHLLMGEALNKVGDAQAAIEALEEALRRDPENPRIYYSLGIAFDRRGMPERAAEMYRRSRAGSV